MDLPELKKGYYYRRCRDKGIGLESNYVEDEKGTFVSRAQGWLFSIDDMYFALEKLGKEGWTITECSTGRAVIQGIKTKDGALQMMLTDEKYSTKNLKEKITEFEKEGEGAISDEVMAKADRVYTKE